MSEPIDTAGVTGTDGASVEQTTPALPDDAARVAAAVAAIGGPKAPDAPTQPAAAKPAAPEEPKVSLADTIRAAREAREQAAQAKQAKSSVEAELAKAKAELAARDKAAFEDDPVGFAKARGWTKEQQLLYGQSLLYDLAPDKADPQFRIKMFEDKQKRREREDAQAKEEAAKAAEARAVQAQLETFYTETAKAVQSTPAGSFPGVEDWFGDDSENLMTSLMATARNLSAAATQQGQVADLRPATLMAALEAEVARRAEAIIERKQKRTAAKTPPAVVPAKPAPNGVQPVETPSTKNMNGSGSARPPATSEKERIARAAAVAFRQR